MNDVNAKILLTWKIEQFIEHSYSFLKSYRRELQRFFAFFSLRFQIPPFFNFQLFCAARQL